MLLEEDPSSVSPLHPPSHSINNQLPPPANPRNNLQLQHLPRQNPRLPRLGFFEAEVAGGLEGVQCFRDAGDENFVGGDVEVGDCCAD